MRKFNTSETAERHLEYRRKCVYKRLEKKGEKILADNSFVSKCVITGKYYAVLLITTQTMVDDITKNWSVKGLLEGFDEGNIARINLLYENQRKFMLKEPDDGMES